MYGGLRRSGGGYGTNFPGSVQFQSESLRRESVGSCRYNRKGSTEAKSENR